jgi:hypothetical protein
MKQIKGTAWNLIETEHKTTINIAYKVKEGIHKDVTIIKI